MHGSFVKPEKLQPTMDLVQALRKRYADEQASYEEWNEAGQVSTALGSEKPIQLIGAKKIRYVARRGQLTVLKPSLQFETATRSFVSRGSQRMYTLEN